MVVFGQIINNLMRNTQWDDVTQDDKNISWSEKLKYMLFSKKSEDTNCCWCWWWWWWCYHHHHPCYHRCAWYLQFVLHVMLFCLWVMFFTFKVALNVVCVQCPIWLFLQFLSFVLSWYVAQVCLIDLKWFQSPLLLLVSRLLSYSTCTEFLLWGLYVLKPSQLLSWSYFCLQELQHLLICMFLVYFHGLQYPVYC